MEYKILDTGYLNVDKTGSQLTDAERAGYNGSSAVASLDIPNVVSCNIGGQANINDSPLPGTGAIAPIGMNSFENEAITLTFGYLRDSVPSGTWGTSYAYQLNRLKMTDGVKLIYPTGTGSMNTALMQLGAEYVNGSFADGSPTEDDGTVSTTTPYIPIKITGVTFTDMSTSKYIKVTIIARRTG